MASRIPSPCDTQASQSWPGLSEGDLREMGLRLAHTIRNPLATIKTSAQLVAKLDMPAAETATYLAGIVREVARIDTAIRGLEDYLQLACTGVTETSVPAAVEDTVGRLSDVERGRLEIGAIPPARVQLTRKLLAGALLELLDNAFRCSPDDRQVTLAASRDGGRVRLDVDDRGNGVAPHLVNRIMRPFFSTTADRSGLGLNRAERICQLGGGSLEWRNRATGGCRFSLVLPEV